MKYFNYINKFDKATEVTLKWIILLAVVTAVSGCDKSNELAVHQESKAANTIADLIIHNAQIITVDENFSI